MTEESTSGLLAALLATGLSLESEADIRSLLLTMSEMLPPGALDEWSLVFAKLGELHPKEARFNILRAILLALNTVEDVRAWGLAWMAALPTAAINPISLPLCAGRWEPNLRDVLVDTYNRRFSPEGQPVVKQWQNEAGPNGSKPRWLIELAPGSLVENILASHDLEVREQCWGTTAELGHGWCVRKLIVGEMPRLNSLGPCLTVMTTLNLLLAPKVQTIEQGSQIGGRTHVWDFDRGRSTTLRKALPKGSWRKNLGWSEGENDLKEDKWGFYRHIWVGDPLWPLPHPITFPDSWMRLWSGYWQLP